MNKKPYRTTTPSNGDGRSFAATLSERRSAVPCLATYGATLWRKLKGNAWIAPRLRNASKAPSGVANHTSLEVEQTVLKYSSTSERESPLGEFGAVAIRREIKAQACAFGFLATHQPHS